MTNSQGRGVHSHLNYLCLFSHQVCASGKRMSPLAANNYLTWKWKIKEIKAPLLNFICKSLTDHLRIVIGNSAISNPRIFSDVKVIEVSGCDPLI